MLGYSKLSAELSLTDAFLFTCCLDQSSPLLLWYLDCFATTSFLPQYCSSFLKSLQDPIDSASGYSHSHKMGNSVRLAMAEIILIELYNEASPLLFIKTIRLASPTVHQKNSSAVITLATRIKVTLHNTVYLACILQEGTLNFVQIFTCHPVRRRDVATTPMLY